MKRFTTSLIVLSCLLSSALLVSCTQMPTERQGIVDMRPQISFKVSDNQLLAARVIVDGLEMGLVGSYLDGKAAMVVRSGTHSLRILLGDRVVLDEKFYSGDGANRTFFVN